MLTLPSPICSWNWLEPIPPSHAPKQDIAVISLKTLLHFWTKHSPHSAEGTQIPAESKYEISHCTQQCVVLPPLLWPDLTANMNPIGSVQGVNQASASASHAKAVQPSNITLAVI